MKLEGNLEDIAYQTSQSAGFDLRNRGEDVVLPPGEWYAFSTGLRISDADEMEYLSIVPRSGLASKHGITTVGSEVDIYEDGVTVLNTPGTVDADYRGQIKVMLINLSSEPFAVTKDMRIAQAILLQYKRIDNVPVIEKIRGTGGFNSTGTE